LTKKWKFLFEKSELIYCELYHICDNDTSTNNLHSEQTEKRTIKTVTKTTTCQCWSVSTT